MKNKVKTTDKKTPRKQRAQPAKAAQKISSNAATESPQPYHLTSAKWQTMDLRALVVVKLAKAIDARGFSQRQAAQYLGVSQPRISDLMRGNTHLFSLDTLIEWMLALDCPVSISFDSNKEWGRSRPQVWSEEDLRDKITYYSKVIKYNPDNSIAYNQRGTAYMYLKEYDAALEDYDKCVDLAPGLVGPLTNRALLHRKAGKLDQSLQDCNEMIKQFPYNGTGYYQRADTYRVLKEYEKALADYAIMIELDPYRPGPYTNRALLYLEINKPEEALADYERALERDPTNSHSRDTIAELKKQIHD